LQLGNQKGGAAHPVKNKNEWGKYRGDTKPRLSKKLTKSTTFGEGTNSS